MEEETIYQMVLAGRLRKLYWFFELSLTCMDGLAQDCSKSIALAMELLQSCAKPSICVTILTHCGIARIWHCRTSSTLVQVMDGLWWMVCAHPISDVVTKQQRISLAGHKPRISPAQLPDKQQSVNWHFLSANRLRKLNSLRPSDAFAWVIWVIICLYIWKQAIIWNNDWNLSLIKPCLVIFGKKFVQIQIFLFKEVLP